MDVRFLPRDVRFWGTLGDVDSTEMIKFANDWKPFDGKPVPVNQVLVQVGIPVDEQGSDGLIYLVLGHSQPPVLTGESHEENLRVAQEMGFKISVETEGVFVMSRSRAEQLVRIMSEFLKRTADTPVVGKQAVNG